MDHEFDPHDLAGIIALPIYSVMIDPPAEIATLEAFGQAVARFVERRRNAINNQAEMMETLMPAVVGLCFEPDVKAAPEEVKQVAWISFEDDQLRLHITVAALRGLYEPKLAEVEILETF